MNWERVYGGKIWEIHQGVHESGKTFEKAVRSPGSRIIILRDGMVLLSREKRGELGGKVDYRLPGGKVFDTNDEFNEFLRTGGDMISASRGSIAREALQEVGIVVEEQALEHIGTDILGATCEWDLYYWVTDTFSESDSGADHQESEADEIQGSVWVPYEEARLLALDPDKFAESRSARMLLTYLSHK